MTGPHRLAVVTSPFISLSGSRYGAVERIVIDRVRALMRFGAEVTLVSPSPGPALPSHFIPLPSPERPASYSSQEKLKWFLSPSTYSHWLRLPGSEIDDIDVVINDGIPIDPVNTFLVTQRLGQTRTLNVLHGNISIDALWARLFRRLARLPIYGCQNRGLFQYIRERGYRAYYTPAGTFFPSSDAVCPTPTKRLIFVGNIIPRKGVHVAIDIARKLRRPISIVGPVGDQAYFHRQIRPRLNREAVYLGELDRVSLQQELRKSAAMLFTTRGNEGQGLVLVEALSLGVPIISTRPGPFSGVSDILEPGLNGQWVDPANPDMASIRELFALDRRIIQTQGRQKWDWDAIIKSHYLPMIEDIMALKGRT